MRPSDWLSVELTTAETSIASEEPSTTYQVPPMVALRAVLTSIMPVS